MSSWSPLEIEQKDAKKNRNVVSEITIGKSPALIIKNFYEIDSCKTIVSRINRNFSHDKEITKKIGVSLLSHLTRKSEYFFQADYARQTLKDVFNNLEDPRKKIHSLLSVLFPTKEIHVASENGKKYACGILRIHNTNDFAPIHRDCVNYEAPNFFVAKFPNQLSLVLYLQQSERGGELVIHKQKWKKRDEKFRDIVFGYSKGVLTCPKNHVKVKPNQGDLIIINPLYFHEILPVKGNKKRVTLGMFLAFSKYGQKVVTWS